MDRPIPRASRHEAGSGVLARHLEFVGALRAAGLPVSVSEDLDAVAALGQVAWVDRPTVREAYAATLVKKHSLRTTFDALFDIYFPAMVGDGTAFASGRARDEPVGDNLDVLETMRREGTQMVVILDEHGGTAGIVTLEDLFEEVVGEIDENPLEPPPAYKDAQGRLRVDGTMRVEEVGQQFDLDVEHVGPFRLADRPHAVVPDVLGEHAGEELAVKRGGQPLHPIAPQALVAEHPADPSTRIAGALPHHRCHAGSRQPAPTQIGQHGLDLTGRQGVAL